MLIKKRIFAPHLKQYKYVKMIGHSLESNHNAQIAREAAKAKQAQMSISKSSPSMETSMPGQYSKAESDKNMQRRS